MGIIGNTLIESPRTPFSANTLPPRTVWGKYSNKSARIARCGLICVYFNVSGKQDAVVVQRVARAGLEALQQIVHAHMRTLFTADVQNNPSAVHHQRPIAERECGAHIVRHHQTRQLLPGGNARGHGENLLRRPRVKRRGVFVEQQKLRLGDRCHQKRQRLPLPAGQQSDRLAYPILQSHIQLAQPLAEVFAVTAADAAEPAAAPGGERQIFFDRHARRGAAHRILKQPSDDLRAPVLRQKRHVLPVEEDFAAIRQKAPADRAEQRGFSRAVRADDRDEISVRHAERKLMQGAFFVDRSGMEGLGDVFQLQHISACLSLHPAADHRQLRFEIRNRNGKHDDDRRHQLQHKCRHIQPQRNGIDQPEDHRAQNRADGTQEDPAAVKHGAADQQRGKGDGHHALPNVDVHGFLVLGKQTARERGEAAGDAQTDRCRYRWVDGRRAHHIGIIAGCADGKPHPGAEKQRQNKDDQSRRRKGGQELILPCQRRIAQRRFHQRKHRLRLVETQQRSAAHDGDVDGIERRIDDDAGKQTVDAHARLQNGNDKPRQQPRAHCREDRQHRMSCHCRDRAGHGAQREAAVR